MTKKIDLAGLRFGRLVVVAEAESKRGNAYWLCECDCGEDSVVAGYALKAKVRPIKSCGCLRTATLTTHSLSRSTEYRAWAAMKTRCSNTKHSNYKNYGGKGIKVSQEWVDSFECFYSDMGDKPSSDFTIERIDSRLGYNKDNCKWIARKDQNKNRVNARDVGVEELPNGKYRAGIGIEYRWIYLGTYTDKEDAIACRIKAEKDYGFTRYNY